MGEWEVRGNRFPSGRGRARRTDSSPDRDTDEDGIPEWLFLVAAYVLSLAVYATVAGSLVVASATLLGLWWRHLFFFFSFSSILLVPLLEGFERDDGCEGGLTDF